MTDGRGVHFAAVVFMGPLAALAIMALRQIHLVSQSPIWVIPLILVGGQLLTTATGVVVGPQSPESLPPARADRVAGASW